MFDVNTGSFDGIEICELFCPFIFKFGREYVGLYCDDGLTLLKVETTIKDNYRSTLLYGVVTTQRFTDSGCCIIMEGVA